MKKRIFVAAVPVLKMLQKSPAELKYFKDTFCTIQNSVKILLLCCVLYFNYSVVSRIPCAFACKQVVELKNVN